MVTDVVTDAVTDAGTHMCQLPPAHLRRGHFHEAFALHLKAGSANPSCNAGPRRVRVTRLSPASRTAHPTAGVAHGAQHNHRKRGGPGRRTSVLVATTQSRYLHLKLKTG